MSGSKPYIYLLDTNFSSWTAEYTDQYFQISLVFGIWPVTNDNACHIPPP